MNTNISINGVTITPEIAGILSRWHEPDDREDSVPAFYARELSDLQDFLCRLLNQLPEHAGSITKLLSSVIDIKDDMRDFTEAFYCCQENDTK